MTAEDEEQEEYLPWLMDLILDGLTHLMPLSLPNTPAEDVIEYTAQVWYEALTATGTDWNAEMDIKRIKTGFRKLTPHLDRWPTPRQLLEGLPARPKPKALPPRRPADLTPEERQMNLSWISQLKTQIKEMEKKRVWPKTRPEDYEDRRWPFK